MYPESTTIALPEHATIAQAQALLGACLSALDHGSIIIDAQAVEEIDFTILQLLASVHKTAQKMQHELHIHTLPGSYFYQKSESLGLQKIFNFHTQTAARA